MTEKDSGFIEVDYGYVEGHRDIDGNPGFIDGWGDI